MTQAGTESTRGRALHISREHVATAVSGYTMLVVFLALIALAYALGYQRIEAGVVGVGLVAFGVLRGFYMLQPNEVAAITLFGAYRGSDRSAGLRWTWPWMSRRKITVRAANMLSDKLKINDQRGNPIEIAANVVYRVVDTAQALFDVDDYRHFVMVQVEAAVRTLGSRYPYDELEHEEITLRRSHDVVNAELRDELIARLSMAGITVDECGLTHLAYAPEIAGAMLRRQQAEAVVAARQKLVEGAVGMVETALHLLSTKQVVELDDERRAAMVSNLMVVLCGERDTQPVVNTGTLYS